MKKLLFTLSITLFLFLGTNRFSNAQTYWTGSSTVQTTTTGDAAVQGTLTIGATSNVNIYTAAGPEVGINLVSSSNTYAVKTWFSSSLGPIFSISNPNSSLSNNSNHGLGIHLRKNTTTGELWIGGYGAASGSGSSINFTDNVNFFNSSTLFNSTTLFTSVVTIGSGLSLPTSNQYKLIVGTGIITEKIKVATAGTAAWSWPDFVFSNKYNLRSLHEVEAFIEKNHHLPDVPSEKDVKANGVDLLEMDATLLKKVEELTLYMIELKKENEIKNKEIELLNEKVNSLLHPVK